MRFHPITQFTRSAIAQLQRRPSVTPYNRQCRPYIPSGHHHHHQFTRKSRITETPSRFSSYFAVFCRNYSSKSSDSDMRLLTWYLRVLEKRPVLTKAVSSAVIYGVADITSQLITMEQHDSWDKIRTLRIAGFGMFILGPAQHLWFNFMARILPKRDMISTLKKLGLGQLFFGPFINGFFFSYNAALQGESKHEIGARLKRDLIPTLVTGLMYWPICDFLTYKVVPVHLQPLMNSSFAYLWSIYLTYMASLEKAVPHQVAAL